MVSKLSSVMLIQRGVIDGDSFDLLSVKSKDRSVRLSGLVLASPPTAKKLSGDLPSPRLVVLSGLLFAAMGTWF